MSKWGLVEWLSSLDQIGGLRLSGVILSCIATNLSMITIATEFWVKQFVRGSFVYRGLWNKCHLGKCSRLTNAPLYILGSIIFMMISAVTAYGSAISGTLSLTPLPSLRRLKWPNVTIVSCFISGFTGGMGLFNYMRSATTEPNTFLAWSLAPGWLSVFMVSLAGACHFVAKRWEEEMLADTFPACTTLHTLEEDLARTPTSYGYLKRRKDVPEPDPVV
ncbi:hypothetical protein lerEdw1_009685 [Lerista edwardsae]|nr:hypothetical protein lerEdw1_009685 [Lerista edwardsae]